MELWLFLPLSISYKQYLRHRTCSPWITSHIHSISIILSQTNHILLALFSQFWVSHSSYSTHNGYFWVSHSSYSTSNGYFWGLCNPLAHLPSSESWFVQISESWFVQISESWFVQISECCMQSINHVFNGYMSTFILTLTPLRRQ